MFFEKEKEDLRVVLAQINDFAKDVQTHVANKKLTQAYAKYRPLISFMNESELIFEKENLQKQFQTLCNALAEKEEHYYELLKIVNFIEGMMEERANILGKLLALSKISGTTLQDVETRMDEEYKNHHYWAKELPDSLWEKLSQFESPSEAMEFLSVSISPLSTALLRGSREKKENHVLWKGVCLKDMIEATQASKEIRQALKAIKRYQLVLLDFDRHLL